MSQSQNWMKMYSSLNSSFKQLINNWASVLEAEMAEVSAAIIKLVTK